MMSTSAEEREFVSYVVELMQSLGPVVAKRMFGGHGIFLDGLMFALIADRALYLKADRESMGEFKGQGLAAFTYVRKGKELSMSYFEAPEETLEDVEQMKIWAAQAYSAALRAAAKKQGK